MFDFFDFISHLVFSLLFSLLLEMMSLLLVITSLYSLKAGYSEEKGFKLKDRICLFVSLVVCILPVVLFILSICSYFF